MPGCRIRFSLVRAATPFTARTIPASARRRRMGACGSHSAMLPPCSRFLARGVSNTKVMVRGPDPPGYHAATQIPQRRQPARPVGLFEDSSVNGKALLGGVSGTCPEAMGRPRVPHFADRRLADVC